MPYLILQRRAMGQELSEGKGEPGGVHRHLKVAIKRSGEVPERAQPRDKKLGGKTYSD